MVEPAPDIGCRPHGRPVRVGPGSEPQATRPTVSDRATPMPHRMRPPPMGWPRSDAAPWHRLPARSRGRKAEAEIKDLPDRLFSHRHHGNSFGRRAIPPVRRNCQSSKDAFVGRHRKAENLATAQCLGNPIAALPYCSHRSRNWNAIGPDDNGTRHATRQSPAGSPRNGAVSRQWPRRDPRQAPDPHTTHCLCGENPRFFKRQSDRGAEPLGRGR